MKSSLREVFSLGLCPPDVETVDPDAIPAMRMGGVAGQPRQPGLRCHVRREIRLPAEFGRGDDVDDGPGDRTLAHVLDGCLHREERTAEVHRDVLVEEFLGGVEQRAARG